MDNQPQQPTAPVPVPPAAPPQNPPEGPGGINLLPQVAEKEIKAGVYKKKANLGALVILGLIGVVIVGILIFQGALAFQANNIKNQTEAAEERIANNQEVEIKALATKEKLDKIEQLLNSAIPSSTFVSEVSKSAATSNPIKLTNVTIDQNGEAFVDGIAANSEVFKQWVANLSSEASQEYFAKINAVSLTGNPSDGYKFSFKMTFLKKGVYFTNEQ